MAGVQFATKPIQHTNVRLSNVQQHARLGSASHLLSKGNNRVRVQSRVNLVCNAEAGKSRIAVLGASGYTGAEIVRLLALHPNMEITQMSAERNAGQEFESVFPHLGGCNLPALVKTDEIDYDQVDAVFCCLPHATTQQIISKVPENIKIVDLSADFRLRDVDTYAEWYGGEHQAPELQKEAIYGLTELHREEIKQGRLIANPGCYPTSIQLPLMPLLSSAKILPEDILIDSKSGVSGAGRGNKQAFLYTEVAEGIHSYGVSRHRHMPEIEQGLSDACGKDVTVSFTPHLMCMSRGMQSTMYVKMADGVSVADLRAHLKEQFAGERFVRVLEEGQVPHTRNVRGSNYAVMNVFEDRIPGRAIVICVIDNLVKGASGQAIQNMNLILGYPEDTAIQQQPMFP